MRAAMEDPEHVVERVKRFMGSVEYKRTFDGHEITPEFLSALILKKLRQDAEKRIGKVGNAVITVPAYFNDARRKATQDAGRIAGLNVIDIINEPTAATLTYAWHRKELGTKQGEQRPHQAMVYDLGGGTFDVTVVRYTPTHFQVLATDGDVQLGGVDWNDRLLEYVAKEFKAKHNLDVNTSPATLQMLRHDCDQAKIALTESTQTKIPCRHEGKSLSVPITREQFEDMTADLLQRTIDNHRAGHRAGQGYDRRARRDRAGGRFHAYAQSGATARASDRQEALPRDLSAHVRGARRRDSCRHPGSPSTATRANWRT